jgi:hypothetical protein
MQSKERNVKRASDGACRKSRIDGLGPGRRCRTPAPSLERLLQIARKRCIVCPAASSGCAGGFERQGDITPRWLGTSLSGSHENVAPKWGACEGLGFERTPAPAIPALLADLVVAVEAAGPIFGHATDRRPGTWTAGFARRPNLAPDTRRDLTAAVADWRYASRWPRSCCPRRRGRRCPTVAVWEPRLIAPKEQDTGTAEACTFPVSGQGPGTAHGFKDASGLPRRGRLTGSRTERYVPRMVPVMVVIHRPTESLRRTG